MYIFPSFLNKFAYLPPHNICGLYGPVRHCFFLKATGERSSTALSRAYETIFLLRGSKGGRFVRIACAAIIYYYMANVNSHFLTTIFNVRQKVHTL